MLSTLLHGNEARNRKELNALLDHAAFNPQHDDIDRQIQQHRIYDQLKQLNQWAGCGSALIRDRRRLFDALAFAATFSPPLFNVAQVHYGVCMTSIRTLGQPSEALENTVAQLDNLSAVASIMITEAGISSSHVALGTRADYDPALDAFILSTPEPAACKLMPNVGLDGVAKIAVVFAQLWCGGKNCGLFPFVTPIRDQKRIHEGIHLKQLPGISSMGLDYCVVSFNGVLVPRTHWLRDTATLDKNGRFTDPLSPSGNTDKRLMRSLAVSTNASTAAAVGSTAAARACVWTALRYASRRKAGARIGTGRAVLQFRNVQALLFSALANTYVSSCLATRLVDGASQETTSSTISTAPWAAIDRIGALTKAVTVSDAADAIRNCRRAAGAHGCLGANRYGSYEDLTDAYASGGGDNELILLEIGRELASLPSKVASAGCALPDSLDHGDALRQLSRYAEQLAHERASRGLFDMPIDEEEDLFPVWNSRLPAVLDLAKTHSHRVALENFLDHALPASERQVLFALATIYASEHFGNTLSHVLRDNALAQAYEVVMQNLNQLLNAFELTPAQIHAPMAQDNYIDAYAGDLPIGAWGGQSRDR